MNNPSYLGKNIQYFHCINIFNMRTRRDLKTPYLEGDNSSSTSQYKPPGLQRSRIHSPPTHRQSRDERPVPPMVGKTAADIILGNTQTRHI